MKSYYKIFAFLLLVFVDLSGTFKAATAQAIPDTIWHNQNTVYEICSLSKFNVSQLKNDAGFVAAPTQTGNAGKVLTTNGTTTNWTPVPVTYTGTTNGSGVYTVTYGTAYASRPNIQPTVSVGGSNKTTVTVTSSSTTGFSLKVELRADVLGVLPSYSNVSGATIDVLVTAQ